MPSKSIKVVSLAPAEEATPEPVAQEEEIKVEEEEPQEEHYEEEPEQKDDVDSEDLEYLVKEYTKQKQQRRKETEPRVGCQHCGKQMSAKSLEYAHQRNCKQDPANLPPPPPPPAPTSTEPVKMKTRAPRRKATKEEAPVNVGAAVDHVILSNTIEASQPLTTSYVKLMELKQIQKQARIKNLAAQAF